MADLRRAQALAAQIENDIEAAGWPVGLNLGSEPDLCARYEVSRGVFREAVRLLEHYSVAHMRPGRHGGLTVTEPDLSTVVGGAALLLRRRLVAPEHLIAARQAIELTCVRYAAEEIDEQGIKLLRDCVRREEGITEQDVRAKSARFHVLIAELTNNPVLVLFGEMMVLLTQQRLPVPVDLHATADPIHHAHEMIAEAIIAGDSSIAQHRMRIHYRAMAASWRKAGGFDGPNGSVFLHQAQG